MALTPISLFQSQGSGIAQFLQGGQNALASALNNVIQVGRDTANKQFAQERDFLGERQRVEALAQRRGENLQQQANLDRSFARSMFESDRQFADTNADQARQEARMSAMDLFNQTQANRNFDLRKSEADRIAEERRRQEEFNQSLLSQPPAGAPAMGAPSRPELSADYLFGPVAGTPAPAPRTGVMGETPEAGMTTAPSLEARIADAQTRMQAAKNIGDAKAYTEAQGNLTAAQAELRQVGGAGLTSKQRADLTFQQGQEDRQRRIQKEEATAAEKAAKTERGKATSQAQILVEANADAFPPAGAAIPEGLSKEEQEAAMAQAKATDANRVAVELQAALDSPTFEDYLAKMVPSAKKEGDTWVEKTPEDRLAEAQRLPKSVKDKRRKLWNLARKTGLGDSETPPAGAPTVETPSTASEVSRLLGKRQALTE